MQFAELDEVEEPEEDDDAKPRQFIMGPFTVAETSPPSSEPPLAQKPGQLIEPGKPPLYGAFPDIMMSPVPPGPSVGAENVIEYGGS